jgi:hypothetical protein
MAKLQESLPQDFFGSDSDGQDISHESTLSLLVEGFEMTESLTGHFEQREKS